MSDSPVTVTFDPPRRCTAIKESWLITAFGEPDLFLPRSKTERTIARNDGQADFLHAVTVPDYVARDRDFGSAVVDCHQEGNDAMTRQDWFLLGATMAILISHKEETECRTPLTLRNVVWDALKVAAKLDEVRGE